MTFSLMQKSPKREHGAIALLVLLTGLAVALAVTATLTTVGVRSLQSDDAQRRGEETFAQVEACLADTLWRLKIDSNFSGGTWTLGDSTCVVTVTGSVGSLTLNVSVTRGPITRRISADVTTGTVVLSGRTLNTLTLSQWREVAP